MSRRREPPSSVQPRQPFAAARKAWKSLAGVQAPLGQHLSQRLSAGNCRNPPGTDSRTQPQHRPEQSQQPRRTSTSATLTGVAPLVLVVACRILSPAPVDHQQLWQCRLNCIDKFRGKIHCLYVDQRLVRTDSRVSSQEHLLFCQLFTPRRRLVALTHPSMPDPICIKSLSSVVLPTFHVDLHDLGRLSQKRCALQGLCALKHDMRPFISSARHLAFPASGYRRGGQH